MQGLNQVCMSKMITGKRKPRSAPGSYHAKSSRAAAFWSMWDSVWYLPGLVILSLLQQEVENVLLFDAAAIKGNQSVGRDNDFLIVIADRLQRCKFAFGVFRGEHIADLNVQPVTAFICNKIHLGSALLPDFYRISAPQKF